MCTINQSLHRVRKIGLLLTATFFGLFALKTGSFNKGSSWRDSGCDLKPKLVFWRATLCSLTIGSPSECLCGVASVSLSWFMQSHKKQSPCFDHSSKSWLTWIIEAWLPFHSKSLIQSGPKEHGHQLIHLINCELLFLWIISLKDTKKQRKKLQTQNLMRAVAHAVQYLPVVDEALGSDSSTA